MKFSIKSWLTSEVIYEGEGDSLKVVLEAGVKAGVCFDRASLDGASLVGASLDRASLDGASLVGARLDRASLVGARLDRARLDRARLDGASLDRASLDGASLDRARLDGASLDGASLDGASLDGASLVGARLTPIRDDIWAVLSASPAEVPALRQAIIEGRVNGSAYEGECACLVGTLANARGCNYKAIPNLQPDSNRAAECFFMAIRKGDTPETNQAAALAVQWVDEWLSNMRAAFGASVAV